MLIEMVNYVPPARELPDIREELAISNVAPNEYRAKFTASLQEGLPRDQCPLFWGFFDPWLSSNWVAAVQLYGELVAARALLRAVATGPHEPGPFKLPPGSGAVVDAEIGQDGKMRPTNGYFLGILAGVEVARIRRCPICGVIYWAGRLDKPACSDRCKSVVRQRRHRERHSERYFDRYKEQRYRKAERDAKANAAQTRSQSRVKPALQN